jgi:hypothetical protein
MQWSFVPIGRVPSHASHDCSSGAHVSDPQLAGPLHVLSPSRLRSFTLWICGFSAPGARVVPIAVLASPRSKIVYGTGQPTHCVNIFTNSSSFSKIEICAFMTNTYWQAMLVSPFTTHLFLSPALGLKVMKYSRKYSVSSPVSRRFSV